MTLEVSSQLSALAAIAIALIGGLAILVAWRQLNSLSLQIRQARLSASMNGFLALYAKYQEMGSLREAIREALPDDWEEWGYEKQVDYIQSKQVSVDGKERDLERVCIDIANLYEMIGSLVYTDALPPEMAFATFGGSTRIWWQRLRSWVMNFRIKRDDKLAFNNFERLAMSFKKEQKA